MKMPAQDIAVMELVSSKKLSSMIVTILRMFEKMAKDAAANDCETKEADKLIRMDNAMDDAESTLLA